MSNNINESITGKWLVREIFFDKQNIVIPNQFGKEFKMSGSISDIMKKINKIWKDFDGYQIDLIEGNCDTYSSIINKAKLPEDWHLVP
jgi:hypothetical protein